MLNALKFCKNSVAETEPHHINGIGATTIPDDSHMYCTMHGDFKKHVLNIFNIIDGYVR
jgi:hypothetical protein